MNETKFTLTLRQCRQNAGLSQRQVAEALGLERSTYAYYETGKIHPSCEMVIKLSRIFNIDYSLFMDAIGDTEFYKNDEDACFTISESKERNKIYQLTKSEQSLVIEYRMMKSEQKKKVMEYIRREQL